MASSLDGAFLKLERGESLRGELMRRIALALDPAQHPVGTTITRRGYLEPRMVDARPLTAYTISLRDDVPVLDAFTGLLLGETIQNFRSALDHMAWAVVPSSTRRRLGAGGLRRIYFPVARSRQQFWRSIDRWLPDTSDELRRMIESYQPYRREPKGRIIRRLRNLSDLDKHRIVVPTVALPIEGELEVIAHRGEIIEMIEHRRRGQAVKPGAKLYTYIVAGADSEMTVRSKIAVRAVLPRSVVKPSRGDVATSLRSVLFNTSRLCAEILTRTRDLSR